MCFDFYENQDMTPIVPCLFSGICWSIHASVYAAICKGPCLYLTCYRFDLSYLKI